MCMRRGSVITALSLVSVVAAASAPAEKRIGEIEFFGYDHMHVNKLRNASPVKEGDSFPETPAARAAMLESIEAAVKATIGRAATDVSPVCCDERGKWTIFIGLGGKRIQYNAEPQGSARLPPHALKLYERFMSAVGQAVSKGDAGEEHSREFALATRNRAERTEELAMREYAARHAALIKDVLASSANDEQRIAAAELLGFRPRRRIKSRRCCVRLVTAMKPYGTTRFVRSRCWRIRAHKGRSRFRRLSSSIC